MHLLAETTAAAQANGGSASLINIVLAVVGGSGILGGLIALMKLRPEANSAAVTQAQGANETLVELNDRLKSELKDEYARRISCEKQLEEAKSIIRQLKDMVHGITIMDDDEHFPPPTPGERTQPS